MSKTSILIDEAISFAQAVLNEDPKKGFVVNHDYKYFSGAGSKVALIDESKENDVIYTAPGQARLIQRISFAKQDIRAGLFPQHNSHGDFPAYLELNKSLKLEKYKGLATEDLLLAAGFQLSKAVLTKKKLSKIQNQFANLNPMCFEEMMCISGDSKQRDFDVFIKQDESMEITIAYLNTIYRYVQFFQSYSLDEFGQVKEVKHVVCETGLPIVINQSFVDSFGNYRNVAHVGITGSKKNSYYNSLERFDDGSLVWTSSDFKFNKNLTGSAVLFEDGSIKIIEGSDKTLSENAARNLGAEAINPKTLKWQGCFSQEGFVREVDDKYVTRIEYKAQIRSKVNQIIDGACIPGLEPIFQVTI